MPRHDGRKPTQLREWKIKRKYTRSTPGSVLISAGRTTVLCTASVDLSVPPWMKGQGKGWVTGEYNMLPGSTSPRKQRERGGKTDGRTTEIQRLIGRGIRAVVDMTALGERTITLDCDVLEADGGTRTASINGAFVALVDALTKIRRLPPRPPLPELPPLREILSSSVGAISVGLLAGQVLLDLDYHEDKDADVDLNLVMTGIGEFIEIQAGGEEATFRRDQLENLLEVGKRGVEYLTRQQKQALGADWPLD